MKLKNMSIYSVVSHSYKGQCRDCELGGHRKGRIMRCRERTIVKDVTNIDIFTSCLVSRVPIDDLIILIINIINGFLDSSCFLALLTESNSVVSVLGIRPFRVEGLLFCNGNARAAVNRIESHAVVGVTPNLAHHVCHAPTSQLIVVWS